MSLRTDVSAALGNAAFQQGLSALKAGDMISAGQTIFMFTGS